jgi:hypothetical protein
MHSWEWPKGAIDVKVNRYSFRSCSRSLHLPFPGLHILAQDGIDRGLVTSAMLAKEREYVGIKAQGDLLLRSRPDYSMRKKVRPKLRSVGIVNILVA